MVINSTRAVAVSIQAVSPLSICAGAAACAHAGDEAARGIRPSIRRPGRHFPSKRIDVDLLGANANGLFQVADEDLAVADLAGAGGAADRLDGAFELFV